MSASRSGSQTQSSQQPARGPPGSATNIVLVSDAPGEARVPLDVRARAAALGVRRSNWSSGDMLARGAGDGGRVGLELDALSHHLGLEVGFGAPAAAARVSAMTPPEIASRLDERFRVLTRGRRTAVERHRTLRATVAGRRDADAAVRDGVQRPLRSAPRSSVWGRRGEHRLGAGDPGDDGRRVPA
jgi:hypothetical protein